MSKTIRLYHATNKENVPSIKKSGLYSDSSGMVYFSTTEKDALRFMQVNYGGGFFKPREEYIVIPFDLPEDWVHILDHGKTYEQYFGKVYVLLDEVRPRCAGNQRGLPAEYIPNSLEDLPVFVIERQDPPKVL